MLRLLETKSSNQRGDKKRMAKDPACGMTVDEKTTRFKMKHMGKTYYFCLASCKSSKLSYLLP
jgi:YHS domain-containing protein